VLFDLLTDRGEKLGLDAYHVAMCGASSGVPDGDPRGLAEAQIVMKHPYVGTFGGGRRFTRSCFEAGISWPIHEVTIASRSVPESVREFASEHQRIGNWDTNFLTYNLFFTRKDDVVTFADGIMGNVSDAETAIAKWLGGLAESRSRKKAAAKASADAVESGAEPEAANKKTGLAGLTASEVVVPGVHFNSRHFYNDVHAGPAGLGLLILAFTRFVNDGQHGGKKSIGFGRFKVRSSTLGGQPLFVESPSNGEYEPNMGNPVVATAMDAWAAYAPTVTAENLTAALLG
jgi:CRISPR type IV-associated protein Csf2